MTEHKDGGLDRRRFLGGMAVAAGTGLMATRAATAQQPAAPPAAGAPAQPAGVPPLRPAPLMNVDGKTAYVTGASSGIGLGIARAAYGEGMKVIIGYIDDSQIDAALAHFPDRSRVHAVKHDVTDLAGWARLVDEAEKKFGRVHLLVNNAGVGIRQMVSEATQNDYDWGMGVNVRGVFNGIQTFVPRMKQYGEGAHIVTTSSMSGVLPGAKAGIYTVTKFAAAGMMEALRVELDDSNIGTSVYLPGGVNTNIARSELYRPAQLKNPNAPVAPPRPMAPAAAAAPRPPPAGMDPLEAGRCVLRGVRNNDLFIFSHPEFRHGMQERFDAIMASIPNDIAMPEARLQLERVTMRVPLYARETERLRWRRWKLDDTKG